MGAVAIPNITVGIVAAGATVTVLCGLWSTYSWTRPLHPCHRSSGHRFSCSWSRGRVLRLESVEGQNRAHMVALVCLCQTRRTLKTSWRAVPGELWALSVMRSLSYVCSSVSLCSIKRESHPDVADH